jgi:hypothetical protein
MGIYRLLHLLVSVLTIPVVIASGFSLYPRPWLPAGRSHVTCVRQMHEMHLL